MKNKFGKKDRSLLRAFTIVDVSALMLFILGAVYGSIIVAGGAESKSAGRVVFGIVMIVAVSPICAALCRVMGRAVLNLVRDVRQIRNRLFDINDRLENTVKEKLPCKQAPKAEACKSDGAISVKACEAKEPGVPLRDEVKTREDPDVGKAERLSENL